MLIQSCLIALIGMGAVFAFLLVLAGSIKLLSKIVLNLSQSNLSEVAAAVVFARHQKGE